MKWYLLTIFTHYVICSSC